MKTITKEFRKTKFLRRLGGGAFDLIIAFILFVVLSAFVIYPCFQNFTDYESLSNEYNVTLVATHLYYLDENGEPMTISNKNYIYQDEALTYFFTNYDSLDHFNQDKENRKDLFTYQDNQYVFNQNALDSGLNAFYEAELNKAFTILSNDQDLQNLSAKLNAYVLGMIAIGIFISLALTLYIPPIFLKNGQTFGKKMMQIRIISRKSQKLHPLQWIIRTSIYFVVECLLSFYSFGIPLLINGIVIFFHPEHLGIHDILCSTVPIDIAYYDPRATREKDFLYIPYEVEEESLEKEGEHHES